MSTYTLDSIVSAVKTILDSHGYSSAISGTGEGKYLDDVIKSALVPAARTVLMAAPVHRLTEASKLTSGTAVTKGGNKGMRFLLPDTFLRFLYGKLSDWKAVVGNLLSEEDTAYLLQSKVGVCANPERPEGFLVRDGGIRYVELYGSATTNITGEVVIVQEPRKLVSVLEGTTAAAYSNGDDFVVAIDGVNYTGEVCRSIAAGTTYYRYPGIDYLFCLVSNKLQPMTVTPLTVSTGQTSEKMTVSERVLSFYKGTSSDNYDEDDTLVFRVGDSLLEVTLGKTLLQGAFLFYDPAGTNLFYMYADQWIAPVVSASSASEEDETLQEVRVWGGDSAIVLPSSLYQAVLYQTAGMTAAQTQEQKLAEDLISIANNLMQ